jgi:ABC-type multidrug transport system ATPase subunit
MFGLLGPNGAGKSTLMRIIATLQEPDSGSVTFGEIDVLQDKTALRRLLGYLPQEFGLYKNVSAEDLLDHFAVLKGIVDKRARREMVDRLLEQTNLAGDRRKHLGGYSGGMRQRFGIAVALLGAPQLIIVDEPTAGLDPAERLRFLNLLAELGQQAVVILSTHIVEDVSDLCPMMAILAAGRVVLEGSPAQLIEQLDGRLWRKTVLKSAVDEYRRELAVISTRLFAGRTQLHVIANERPESGFEPVPPDLEDVYFSALAREMSPELPAC